jgi:hypothetical protein
MDPDLLNELKIKSKRYSLRNRISSSNLNNEYIELQNNNVDIENNSVNAENDFDFPPPPHSLLELPEELAEDYYPDFNKLNRRINIKLCCFGFFILFTVCGLGVIYKYFII